MTGVRGGLKELVSSGRPSTGVSLRLLETADSPHGDEACGLATDQDPGPEAVLTQGHAVILHGRNRQKTLAVQQQLGDETGNTNTTTPPKTSKPCGTTA